MTLHVNVRRKRISFSPLNSSVLLFYHVYKKEKRETLAIKEIRIRKRILGNFRSALFREYYHVYLISFVVWMSHLFGTTSFLPLNFTKVEQTSTLRYYENEKNSVLTEFNIIIIPFAVFGYSYDLSLKDKI